MSRCRMPTVREQIEAADRIRETDAALKISEEVSRENGEAEQRLVWKCRWEKMTRLAVILEWGDPRKWL